MKISDKMILAMNEIKKITRSSEGGDGFDRTVIKTFKDFLKYDVIEASEFKKNYPEYKKKCSVLDLNFDNITLNSGIKRDDFLIISQPNGKQSFPDILIIHNKKGYPIEIKSSKTDQIIWNSGLPRENAIYIYNRYNGNKTGTTFFMGQDVITKKEKDILMNMDEQHKKSAKTIINGLCEIRKDNWLLYPRPMYVSKIKYIGSPECKNRENSVIEFIKSLK